MNWKLLSKEKDIENFLRNYKGECTIRFIARETKVSYGTALKWVHKFEEQGKVKYIQFYNQRFVKWVGK